MPIQIDRMDTSVEILPPSQPAKPAGGRAASPTSDGDAKTALREAVGTVMAEELDRFIRNRGMGL